MSVGPTIRHTIAARRIKFSVITQVAPRIGADRREAAS